MTETGPAPDMRPSPPEPEGGIRPNAGRLERAEQALRAAEEFNRAILDAVSAQVAVLDNAGTIITVNRPWRLFALENTGRPGEAAPRTNVGTNYLDVCRAARGTGAEGAMAVHEGIRAVLERRRESFSYEYPYHAPTRKRWFRLTATALGGPHGGAVVSHADISAPMKLSDRLKVTNERLALAQDSAGVRKEAVDLATLIPRAVSAILPVVERKGVALTVQLPTAPMTIDADPVRLTQIVVNLLDNAAKFTPDGGRIDLTARPVGQELEIRVQDNGCGIPPALLSHVFELFQQGEEGLDRASGGLGIGLTLVQRLVALHGGSVEAASAGAECGSTFTLRLPAASGAAARPFSQAEGATVPATRKRILVVDDDASVADSTALWLEMEGYEIRVARSGPAAIAEAVAFQPDVVLLDIGLAGMDGYEVARRLRALPGGGATFVLAVTGYGDEEAVARSRAAGFDHHLIKPFDPRSLLTLLATPRSPGE